MNTVPSDILKEILNLCKYKQTESHLRYRHDWVDILRVCKIFYTLGCEIFLPDSSNVHSALQHENDDRLILILRRKQIQITQDEIDHIIDDVISNSTTARLQLLLSHPKFKLTDNGGFQLRLAIQTCYQSSSKSTIEILLNADGVNPNIPCKGPFISNAITALDFACDMDEHWAIRDMVNHPKVDLAMHPGFLSKLKYYASNNWGFFNSILREIPKERGQPIQRDINSAICEALSDDSSKWIFYNPFKRSCVDVSFDDNAILKRALKVDALEVVLLLLQNRDIKEEGIPVDELYEYRDSYPHIDIVSMMVANPKLERLGKRMKKFESYDQYQAAAEEDRDDTRACKRQKTE